MTEFWFVLFEKTDDEEIEVARFHDFEAAETYGYRLAAERNTDVRVLQEMTVCIPQGEYRRGDTPNYHPERSTE